MRSRSTDRSARIPVLLVLAGALLLLCAGGIVLQHSAGPHARPGAGGREGNAPDVVGDHVAMDGAHQPALVESVDSEEMMPVGSEHLNALALGLFLVSLGLLLGAGLAGRGAETRRLNLLRLPSTTPQTPAGAPLSLLEVFRV